MEGVVENVAEHGTCLGPVRPVLVDVGTQISDELGRIHRSLRFGGHRGPAQSCGGVGLGIVVRFALVGISRDARRVEQFRLSVRLVKQGCAINLISDGVVAVVQVLDAKLSKLRRLRLTANTGVVGLRLAEELHQAGFIAKAGDVLRRVRGNALEGLDVLLVETGEVEGEGANDNDGSKLFGGHLAFLLEADALGALVLGFGLTSLGVDQLLIRRHSRHRTLPAPSCRRRLHLTPHGRLCREQVVSSLVSAQVTQSILFLAVLQR
mmetsp:Transcript_30706/g.91942  ORF Transcript_30706/g.91942 Transcript_30706/m.91942 type:complete len:265 (-) Transcript_30706:1476-2270(-)